MMKKAIYMFCALIMIGVSCKNEKEAVLAKEDTQGFFPLEIGKYKVYKVDSIFFNINNPGSLTDTSSYFIKETLISKHTDDLGDYYFNIAREEKLSLNEPWSNTVILKEQVTLNQALRTENNRKFIKLVFPVTVFKQWDFGLYLEENLEDTIPGGRIQIFKNWAPYIASLEQDVNVNGQQFDEVTTVIYADYSDDKYEVREAVEIYAKDVGLISKEMRILDTQNIDTTIPFEERTENGFVIHQSIIDFN